MKKTSTLIKLTSAVILPLFIASCDGGGGDNDNDGEALNLRAQPAFPTNVTIEASGPITFNDGIFFTHNGTVDIFDTGSPASEMIMRAAEIGDVSSSLSIFSTFDSTQFRDVELLTFIRLEPGNSETRTLNFSEGARYFSFTFQAVPSSDTFIGNDDPLEFDVYQMLQDSPDGTVTIEVTQLFDAGTEVNDFLTSNGNEFIAGLPEGDPEAGEDENGVITLHTPTFYDEYLNPGDFDVSTLNPGGTVVARITFTRTDTQ